MPIEDHVKFPVDYNFETTPELLSFLPAGGLHFCLKTKSKIRPRQKTIYCSWLLFSIPKPLEKSFFFLPKIIGPLFCKTVNIN